MDITEAHAREHALRRSQQGLREAHDEMAATLDALPDLMRDVDEQGCLPACPAAGMNDFVAKPLDDEALHATLPRGPERSGPPPAA